MAHLTKADRRRMIEIRTDYVSYLRTLMESVNSGDLEPVIEFCNRSSVKIDVECLLQRRLNDEEGTCLLLTPEVTTEALGAKFGRAHMIAYNMKHTRQLCRTLLRQGRIEGIGRQFAELLEEVEAYAV